MDRDSPAVKCRVENRRYNGMQPKDDFPHIAIKDKCVIVISGEDVLGCTEGVRSSPLHETAVVGTQGTSKGAFPPCACLRAELDAQQEKSMIPKSPGAGTAGAQTHDKITYIRQMLGELRGVAASEGADMLCYLIEMACVEAGDILSGKRQLSFANGERNKAAGMPVKPPGKIQF
ncbi:hypothetical protein ACLJYM_07880 [Rhizobium giardinii]|jgi:hypothetical protein